MDLKKTANINIKRSNIEFEVADIETIKQQEVYLLKKDIKVYLENLKQFLESKVKCNFLEKQIKIIQENIKKINQDILKVNKQNVSRLEKVKSSLSYVIENIENGTLIQDKIKELENFAVNNIFEIVELTDKRESQLEETKEAKEGFIQKAVENISKKDNYLEDIQVI